MDLSYNPFVGQVLDSLYGLYFIFNDNYTELMTQYQIPMDSDVEKAYKHIQNKLYIDYDFMPLFFKKSAPNKEVSAIFPPFSKADFLVRFSDLKSYLSFLENTDEFSVQSNFIGQLFPSKKEDISFPSSLLEDERKLVEEIDLLDLSPELKWRTLQFIKNPMPAMKEYLTLLHDFFALFYSSSFQKYLKKYDVFCSNFETLQEEEQILFLKKHMGHYWNETLFKEKNTLYFLFFNAMSAFSEGDADHFFLFVGYRFDKVIQQIAGDNEINQKLNVLKNISDPTRFKILMLLKERDLYGQELAEKVGITLPTISYHMNFLLAGGMVETVERGHRIYYRFKKNAFIQLSTFIQNLFLN